MHEGEKLQEVAKKSIGISNLAKALNLTRSGLYYFFSKQELDSDFKENASKALGESVEEIFKDVQYNSENRSKYVIEGGQATTTEEASSLYSNETEQTYIQIIAKCAQALADTAIAAKESALAAKEAALATKDSVNATNRVLDMMPPSLARPADQIDRVSEELRVERLGVMALTRMTLERFARQEGRTYDDLYQKEFCNIVAELEGSEKQDYMSVGPGRSYT